MDDRRTRHRAVVREVLDVLNRYDLSALGPGEEDGPPYDEYLNEALPIASALLNRGSIEHSDVSRVWLEWFGDDLSALPKTTWTRLLRDLNAILE